MAGRDDIDVGVSIHAEGRQLARQLAADVAALRVQLTQLVTITREVTAVSKTNAAAVQQQSSAFAGLGKQLAALAAAFGAFQAFKAFVAEGLKFNETIETANLGIASLITAQTKMVDANGQLVTGVEKLAVAQSLAADQVQKLRIAGLQTTATTQDLVVAFQQAIGVGLRWGLTLDQIRTLTIQMSQAAGALGLPMNQLNEEIRDLLAGNINARNTRIATALGITNEQIKTAQRAGQLFQFVTARLEAFSVAGAATAKTFAGVVSNIKEALQNLAGDTTKPLFDAIKVEGQAALEQVFDLKNARISANFAGILDVARGVFKDLGDLLGNALSSAVEGAKEFSRWLRDNRLAVAETYAALKLVGDQMLALVGDALGLATQLGAVATASGFLKDVFIGLGGTIALIRNGVQGILIVLGTIGGIIITAVVAPFVGLLKILARVTSVINDDMARSLDNAASAGQDFIVSLREGMVRYIDDLAEGGLATTQYAQKLQGLEANADSAALAQARLSNAVNAATQAEITATAALDAQLKSHAINQTQYAERVAAVKLESIAKQIAAEKAYFATLDASDNRERRRTLATIDGLKARAAALAKNVTITPLADPTKAKESPAKVEQAANIAIKAALEARLSELKILLDNQRIAYSQYYANVTAARLKAVDAEIAAIKKLEASQTDKGALAKSEAQIRALEESKTQIVAEENEKKRKSYLDLNDDVTKANIQLLKDQGRFVDAAALETGAKFRELIARLKAEVAAGTAGAGDQLSIVEQLFGIDQAKVRLQELQTLAKNVTETLAVQLAAINTESTTHAITEAEAREKVVAAYTRARDALVATLPAMREAARLTGDPAQINAVEELAIKIGQMGVTIQQTSDKLLQFRQNVRETFESGLADFIDQAGAGAKSLKDVWIDTAASIIASLRRIAAQMLANMIIQRALAAFGGFAGGGAAVVGAATGGYIVGPGTETSDSIPARLSRGEYVVRAASVRAVGVELLERINTMGAVHPRPRHDPSRLRRFAEGGLVAATSNAPGQNARLEIGLEAGLVLNHLDSDAGTKIVMRKIEKNSKKINATLGR